MNKNYLPTVHTYTNLLGLASAKFKLSINECRDKFGKFTIQNWENLLNIEL